MATKYELERFSSPSYHSMMKKTFLEELLIFIRIRIKNFFDPRTLEP